MKKYVKIAGSVNRKKRDRLYVKWAKHQKKPTRQKFSDVIIEVGLKKVEFEIERWGDWDGRI